MVKLSTIDLSDMENIEENTNIQENLDIEGEVLNFNRIINFLEWGDDSLSLLLFKAVFYWVSSLVCGLVVITMMRDSNDDKNIFSDNFYITIQIFVWIVSIFSALVTIIFIIIALYYTITICERVVKKLEFCSQINESTIRI